MINWLHQKGEFDKQGIAKACRSKDNLNKAENKYFSVSELLIFKNNPINEANSELLNHLPTMRTSRGTLVVSHRETKHLLKGNTQLASCEFKTRLVESGA